MEALVTPCTRGQRRQPRCLPRRRPGARAEPPSIAHRRAAAARVALAERQQLVVVPTTECYGGFHRFVRSFGSGLGVNADAKCAGCDSGAVFFRGRIL